VAVGGPGFQALHVYVQIVAQGWECIYRSAILQLLLARFGPCSQRRSHLSPFRCRDGKSSQKKRVERRRNPVGSQVRQDGAAAILTLLVVTGNRARTAYLCLSCISASRKPAEAGLPGDDPPLVEREDMPNAIALNALQSTSQSP